MINNFLKRNTILTFCLIAFLLLFSRIFLPTLYYPGEDNLIRLAFETKSGASYLPIIKSYSNFMLSPLYGLENELSNKNLAFPYLALFIPSILLKLFGPTSFIFLEFFAVTFFLIIIYKILILLNFNNLISVIISCSFFLLPKIVNELNYLTNIEILEIINNNLKSFYILRIPRPLITNLYFFSFIFLLMKIDLDKKYSIKRSCLLGLLIGLSIHSLFFIAIIKFFILFFYLIINFKRKIFKMIFQQKKFFITLTMIVGCFMVLFIIHLNKVSPNNATVIGLYDINYEQKINLIKYTIRYFSNKFFLLLFFINLVLFLYLKKKNLNFTIVYLIYISSIVTFLFFIIFVNKNIHYDLIQRTIFNNGILFFILATFKVMDINFKVCDHFISKYYSFLVIILICLNNYLYFKHYDKNNILRFDADKVVKKIEEKNFIINKKNEILVLDSSIFIYLVGKDFLNFTIVPNSFWTTRSFEVVEKNLINSFKILGIKNDNFKKIFKNKDSNFRIINSDVSAFFGYRYLANSSITFKGLNNYTTKEIKIIKSTSPFVTQLIMPEDELVRIFNKFLQIGPKISKPTMIIINKNDNMTKDYSIDINQYCISYMNRSFVIYKSILYCK